MTEGGIAKESIVKSLVDKTIDEYEKVDILVNNAGIVTKSKI
ncbi:SDR family NAD(P)-dependent oxidoreductase [Halalkalibacter nanhaiisediminis]|nr:SDR family NAD(P)-dependent oxidoreductase [Halalkalibacter nanhaiisediminis]